MADELVCADLAGLLGWIAVITHVKTFDARRRRPVGTQPANTVDRAGGKIRVIRGLARCRHAAGERPRG